MAIGDKVLLWLTMYYIGAHSSTFYKNKDQKEEYNVTNEKNICVWIHAYMYTNISAKSDTLTITTT
jgi:hypothetical protein